MAAGAQNTDGARHAEEEEEETDGRRDATVGRPLSLERGGEIPMGYGSLKQQGKI